MTDDAVSYCIYCTLPVVKYASWPGAGWVHQRTGSKWCRLSVATVRDPEPVWQTTEFDHKEQMTKMMKADGLEMPDV